MKYQQQNYSFENHDLGSGACNFFVPSMKKALTKLKTFSQSWSWIWTSRVWEGSTVCLFGIWDNCDKNLGR